MAKFNHASDKLCAMTLHRGTIIQIDSEFLHVRMLMSIVMPPRLQTIHNSTVVFWVARVKPSPCHNHRLLGEQRGEEIFRPLPEFEALVGMQDQCLNECLRLLTTRFPNGFDGYAPFCR